MSRFRNKVDAQQAHILSLRLAVAILALLCSGFWYGWQTAPSELTIHVPPDLRSGSTRKWWDVPPENIYAFALYIFGQLNRCLLYTSPSPRDGLLSRMPSSA